MTDEQAPKTWQMYGYPIPHSENSQAPEEFNEVYEHLLSMLRHTHVLVTVTENPEGHHWGWHDNKSDEKACPLFINPGESLLSMCFPYGLEAARDAGQGRVVRLDVVRAIIDG